MSTRHQCVALGCLIAAVGSDAFGSKTAVSFGRKQGVVMHLSDVAAAAVEQLIGVPLIIGVQPAAHGWSELLSWRELKAEILKC